MNQFKPVIGLEIHVELKTKSKMFCQCEADYFNKPPNSQVCPVCLGLPGALPVPNKKAISQTILLGKALNCRINKISKFDRKHYFYPDLPKGYQISQYDEPIAVKGKLQITNYKLQINNKSQSSNIKTFRIHRVHLEEDTGKLIHKGDETLIDFNRSGVPLVEIVTEPEFNNSDDVKRFLEELQVLIRYLNISDADMEKGSMRLEPNISMRKITNYPLRSKTSKLPITNKSKIQNFKLPNYKVEVKNINSFRFVKQAIEFEIKRQTGLLEKGETPKQETRGFNSEKMITYSQRSKETAHDYRYFPEPDIPPITISQHWLDDVNKNLPELPQQKLERYVRKYGLKQTDALILTRDIKISQYYELLIAKIKNQKSKIQIKNQRIEQYLANLIINKKILTDISVDEFVKKVIESLTPKKTDEKELETLIKCLIKENEKVVNDYKKGKKNAIMFLVGQVMKEMKGKAEAKTIISILKKKLT